MDDNIDCDLEACDNFAKTSGFADDDVTESVDPHPFHVDMTTSTQSGFPTLINGAIIMLHNPALPLASEDEEADMTNWDLHSPWTCTINLLPEGSTALDPSARCLGTITLTPEPDQSADGGVFFESIDPNNHSLLFMPDDWREVDKALDEFAIGTTEEDFKPSDVSGTWYRWRQDTGQEYEELEADAEMHFRPIAVEPNDLISRKRTHSPPRSEDADQEIEPRTQGKKARLLGSDKSEKSEDQSA